jgi:Ca-activated chloride channel family protein
MRPRRRGILLAALISLTLAAGAAMHPPGETPEADRTLGSVRSGAVELGASLDRHSVLAGGDGTVRVELEITGDEPPFADRPVRTPTDLLVILDRSGSMQGEPLEFAKASIFELISQLEREDRFGLVTYATGGEVAIDLEAATDVEKSRWQRVVRAVNANGGTNMALGLDLAHRVVTGARRSGRAPRVILISDGHANQGDHSVEGLRARAARAIQEEYVLTTVGVAQGFDENVMSTVADAGTGNFYYLPSLRALAGVFADEFASARERVASALEVLLRPGDGVRVIEAAGLPLEKTQDGVRFHPGDLFAGQERRIWLTLRTPTRNVGELALGRISLRFTDSDGERRDLELGELPQVACVAAEADYYASFAADVYRRGSGSEVIGALKQKVAAHMKAGRQAEAVAEVETHLEEMKTEQLRALGYVVSGDAESVQRLRDTVAAPSAAEPDVQNRLGKSLLEEGRDERRVGSKRK